MANRPTFKRQHQAYRPIMLAGVALAILVAWLLFGSTGIFAWSDYNRQLRASYTELAELRHEQARLINRQALLNPRTVDPDLADEMVRRNLNLLHPDDIVIPMTPSHNDGADSNR